MEFKPLEIFISVACGIVTFCLIELGRVFFKDHFIPWIERRLYSDIDLTDTWIEEYHPIDPSEKEENGQEQTISLELKQKAHTISGTAILSDNKSTKQPVGTRKMKVTGKIDNRHVSLHLKLDNSKKFGLVTYLVEVTSGGEEMKGFTSYYNPLDKGISTANCILKRQPGNV